MPIIIVCSIIISILFLFSRLQFEIEYKRENENDRFTFTLKYLGKKIYEFDISMIDISKAERGYGFKLSSSKFKKQPEDDGESFLQFDTIINWYNDIKRYYKIYTITLNNIVRKLADSIIVRKLDINVEVGAFEHVLTGISSGVIYALAWNFFCYIASKVKTEEHEISVKPRFDINVFKLNLFCIFTVRIGNIIYVVTRLVLLYAFYRLTGINKAKKLNNNLNIN